MREWAEASSHVAGDGGSGSGRAATADWCCCYCSAAAAIAATAAGGRQGRQGRQGGRSQHRSVGCYVNSARRPSSLPSSRAPPQVFLQQIRRLAQSRAVFAAQLHLVAATGGRTPGGLTHTQGRTCVLRAHQGPRGPAWSMTNGHPEVLSRFQPKPRQILNRLFGVNLSRERGKMHSFLFLPRVLHGFPHRAKIWCGLGWKRDRTSGAPIPRLRGPLF